MRSTITATATATAFAIVSLSIAGTGCAEFLGQLTGHPVYKDTPPANDFVKSQVGKIVFSSQEIPADVSSSDSLSTSLTVDKPIWWRPFYAHSPYNSILAAGMQCHDNDHEFYLEARDVAGPADNWKHLFGSRTQILAQDYVNSTTTIEHRPMLGKKAKEKVPAEDAIRMLAYLTTFPRGTITLEFRYSVECPATNPKDKSQSVRQPAVVLARGTAKFTVTDAGLANYVNHNGMAMESVAFAHPADRKRIEAAARNFVAGKPVVAFFMRQPDWNIERDALNRVLNRNVVGTIVVRDGQNCVDYDFRAYQANMGGSKYVETPHLSAAYADAPLTGYSVPCAAVPKLIR